jgi:hypothetical protein
MVSIAPVCDGVDQGWLSGFDHIERALDRGTDIFGIGDRTDAEHAVGPGHVGVVDVRIGNGGANVSVRCRAIGTRRHCHYVHELLMIGPVVVHDCQERDAVMDHAEAKVSFSAPGTCRIRAIATDGWLFSTFDVDVKVNPGISAGNAHSRISKVSIQRILAILPVSLFTMIL